MASAARPPVQVVTDEADRTLLEAAMRARVAAQREDILRTEQAPSPEAQETERERNAILARARRDFRYFLQFWEFVNRETGDVQTFGHWDQEADSFVFTWEGQDELGGAMEAHPWLFALKAGKLGFSELECAYDAWVVRFRQRNARVHIFSRVEPSAVELLGIVKFGLRHLPPWMRFPILENEPGGDTTRSLKLMNPQDPDDVRSVLSYASRGPVAIEQSAAHSHVDELAHMQQAEQVWSSVSTTVPENGSIHIVTRGAGSGQYAHTLWASAVAGEGRLHPFFADWTKRPRPEDWYEKETGNRALVAQSRFAPRTVEEAFADDETQSYIPVEIWRRRAEKFDEIGPKEPCVLGVDAAITNDMYAVVVVTRHPDPARRDEPAIRLCNAWKPTPGHPVDLAKPDAWIRIFVGGACKPGPDGHPPSMRSDDCAECATRVLAVAGHNVIQIAYDHYQMESVAQQWRKDGIGPHIHDFDQMNMRLMADGDMFRRAMTGTMSHNGDPTLEQHIGNSAAKTQADEDSKMRIIKRAPSGKVDLAVASSMACWDMMKAYV